jgi:hypothetical protein
MQVGEEAEQPPVAHTAPASECTLQESSRAGKELGYNFPKTKTLKDFCNFVTNSQAATAGNTVRQRQPGQKRAKSSRDSAPGCHSLWASPFP